MIFTTKQFSKDDYEIRFKKVKNIEIVERRKQKSKTIKNNKQNLEKSINVNKNKYKKDLHKEQVDKNESTKDTTLLSNKENNNTSNEEPTPKESSHSSKDLIKVDKIKSPIEYEYDTKNKSDDEVKKMDRKVHNNKEFESINDKEEEIIKKDNINFNNNIKSIFNNIGNIKKENVTDKTEKKGKDKIKEKDELILSIYNKGEKNIRKLYYSQLLLKKIWKPINDSKRHNNLIIFDWDDTLLPTSFLTPRGIFEDNSKLSEKDQSKINKLEKSVKKLLELVISKGNVYIITNAGDG